MNIDDLLFERNYDLHWQMARGERLMMVQLLKGLKPSLAIEIGTYKGGSLQVIAEYSQRVISLDANPKLEMEFGTRFPNVEFAAGYSQHTLPGIVDRLNADGQSPEFVLVDGDHSANGVRNDINLLLGIKPQRSMLILMHDCYNPDCRRGMLEAAWETCPFVQSVDIDFVTGRYASGQFDTAEAGSMWSGLGCAILAPERRVGALLIKQSQKETVEAVRQISVHRDPETVSHKSPSLIAARVRSVLRPLKRYLTGWRP